MSQIKAVLQVTYVGRHPGTRQTTTYSTMILQNSVRAGDTQTLVHFFASPDFKTRLHASGFATAT